MTEDLWLDKGELPQGWVERSSARSDPQGWSPGGPDLGEEASSLLAHRFPLNSSRSIPQFLQVVFSSCC